MARSERIYIRLSEEEKTKLQKLADNDHRTISDYVRLMILERLKEDKKMKTYYTVVINTNPRSGDEYLEYKGSGKQEAIRVAEKEWDRMNKQDKSHHRIEVRDITPVDYDEDGEVVNYDWDTIWESDN